MSTEASEMVSVPRAELDSLKAEVKRLRREVGRGIAKARIEADPGPGMARLLSRASSWGRRGESVSDRLVRFPGASWSEIEALPQSLRWTVQRVIFHLLDEPIPTLADPFPSDAPLPGAYELHLPSDGVTIWYTVTPHGGQEIINVQHVHVDT